MISMYLDAPRKKANNKHIPSEQWKCLDKSAYFDASDKENSLPGPALESGHNEECEHCMHDVVIVKGTSLPHSVLHNGLVDISILVSDELSLTGLFDIHTEVGAHEKLPLEKLDTNNAEHEYQQNCYGHDVTNGFH